MFIDLFSTQAWSKLSPNLATLCYPVEGYVQNMIHRKRHFKGVSLMLKTALCYDVDVKYLLVNPSC